MASEHVVNLKVKFESDAKAGIKATADSLKSNLGGALKDSEKKSKELKASLTNFKELGKIFKDIAPDIGAPFAKGTKLASEMGSVLPKLSPAMLGIGAAALGIGLAIGGVALGFKLFFGAALKQSPELAAKFELMKERIASITNWIADKLTPAFTFFVNIALALLPTVSKEFDVTAKKILETQEKNNNKLYEAKMFSADKLRILRAKVAGDEEAELRATHISEINQQSSTHRAQYIAAVKAKEDTNILGQLQLLEIQNLLDEQAASLLVFNNKKLEESNKTEKELTAKRKQEMDKRKKMTEDFEDFEKNQQDKLMEQIDKRISKSKSLKDRVIDQEFSDEETTKERKEEILSDRMDAEIAIAEGGLADKYAIAQYYAGLFDALDEDEKNKKIKNSDDIAKKEKENIDKMSQAKFAAAGASANLLGALASLTKSGTKVSRQEANIAKGLAIGEATINTFAGATRAYKDFPYPMSAVISGLVVATGLANVAAIANQKFAKGGLIPAGERSITVNEAGQESVLNARATQRLGREGVDRLNRGEGGSSGITISYAPTFHGSTTMEAVGAINRHTDEELRRLAKNIQDIRDRGITP